MSNIVVITGASGALGAVLARRLVLGGARVAAVDRAGSSGRLDALAKELGPACFPVGLDVTDLGAWADAISKIEAALGPPDGAALVAGGFTFTGPLHTASEDAWREMMAINADTAERTLRALLPGMVARRKGSVVLVGARTGDRPWSGAGMAAYTASKAAVLGLVQAVAAEVLSHEVRVNAVLPSVLDTPRNRADMPDVDPARWVTAESLSEVIAFLLSDSARDVSGALVPVYGRA